MAAVNPQLSNLNFWKTFDLVKFQKDLDQVALEIANRQDESDISRQKLVEQSREFKKNTPEDVKKYVGPLFKNFQQEIDSLSKRSKSGEAAFLSVYKQIIDFVDPSPLVDQCEKLQKSSQKVRDLELENKLLRDTLDDCKNDLGLVRQSEDMVKKLESKIKETDRNINALTEAAVAKIRAEMMASYAEKEALSNVEKEQLLATIEHLRGEIIMFRSSFDSVNAELLELRIKYDEHLTAKNSEVDMLAGDIDKLQTRAQSAEHECERLRKEMDHLRDPNSNQAIMGHDSSSVIKGLEKEAETRDKEARHLMEEVGRMKQNYGILEQVTATKIAYLEEQLSQKSSTYDELHQRLSTMADYQANKRELSILKSMEFSESSGEGNSLETPSIGEKEKALEILVMEKNKTLKSENSTMKVQKMQMNEKYDRLLVENMEKEKQLREKTQLIDRLEKDLSALETITAGYRGDGEGQPSPPSSIDLLKSATSQTFSPRYSSMESLTSTMTCADSILPIVSSQKERFKTRNRELENENGELKKKVHIVNQELDQYKNDNLMLYEKIRFLQSYGGNYPATPTTPGTASTSQAMNRRVEVERGYYHDRYEARLDPFSDFHHKERLRKINNLSPPEKMIHFMATRMVSNRSTRIFAFVYTIVLHCLVFLVLYQLAKIEGCQRDASLDWANKYAKHMEEAHGDGGI